MMCPLHWTRAVCKRTRCTSIDINIETIYIGRASGQHPFMHHLIEWYIWLCRRRRRWQCAVSLCRTSKIECKRKTTNDVSVCERVLTSTTRPSNEFMEFMNWFQFKCDHKAYGVNLASRYISAMHTHTHVSLIEMVKAEINAFVWDFLIQTTFTAVGGGWLRPLRMPLMMRCSSCCTWNMASTHPFRLDLNVAHHTQMRWFSFSAKLGL